MVGGWVGGTDTDTDTTDAVGVGVVMVLRAGIMIMICYLFVTFFVLVLSCRLCLLMEFLCPMCNADDFRNKEETGIFTNIS